MYKNMIGKIKSCLPTSRDKYVIHEPFFDDKSFIDTKKCLESSFVSTQGYYLEKFESKLRDITGSNHVILTNTGTAALFLSLKISDINQTEVLVPSMTFAATVKAILYNRGAPNVIDGEEDSPNGD